MDNLDKLIDRHIAYLEYIEDYPMMADEGDLVDLLIELDEMNND